MNRIKTYIQGMDVIMGGGIPEGHVVLVAGEPGSYKSSIAFSLVYNNVLKDKKVGCYITLEQGRDSLMMQMDEMGMPFEPVEGHFNIVDLALIRRNLDMVEHQPWMQVFKTYANNLKENIDYDILVIDSLPVLMMLADFKNPRNEMFHFFEWLRDMKVTTLILAEAEPGSDEYSTYGENFLADGIIHLKMEKVSDVNIQRRIRIVKMRSASHSPDFFTLLFQKGEFRATRVIGE